MTNDIQPCPMCGSVNIQFLTPQDMKSLTVAAECLSCGYDGGEWGCCGGDGHDREWAMFCWNAHCKELEYEITPERALLIIEGILLTLDEVEPGKDVKADQALHNIYYAAHVGLGSCENPHASWRYRTVRIHKSLTRKQIIPSWAEVKQRLKWKNGNRQR